VGEGGEGGEKKGGGGGRGSRGRGFIPLSKAIEDRGTAKICREQGHSSRKGSGNRFKDLEERI